MRSPPKPPPHTRRRGSPYPGPRPFDKTEASRFFGRKREVSEVFSLLHTHQLVLLYAQSGCGKTSMLRAGLLPLMDEARWDVLPIARVGGDLRFQEADNIYAANSLLKWSGSTDTSEALQARTIPEFLKRDRPAVEDGGRQKKRVLVFDQFEELFAFYPAEWTKRRDFLQQISEAAAADPAIRVLLVMREDYLAHLEPFAGILPGRLRTRYRLEKLKPEAATLAVRRPLEGTQVRFAPGVAESIVKRLAEIRVREPDGTVRSVPGQFLEPMQLQIVCKELWEDLDPDVTQIEMDDVQKGANVDQALLKFYEGAVSHASTVSGVPEGDIRDWFDQKLITESQTRGFAVQGATETEGLANTAVEILQSEGIVRAEFRAGAPWYELPHDRFIEPVQLSNRGWSVVRRARRVRTAESSGLSSESTAESSAMDEDAVWNSVEREVDSLRSVASSVVTLRRTIGMLALTLPFVLVLGARLLFGEDTPRGSIAAYLDSGMQSVLVAMMAAIAVLLFTYRGYERRDDLAGDIAGAMALAYAISSPNGSGVERLAHYASEVLFLMTMAYFTLVLFPRGAYTSSTHRKLARNRVYRVCGIVILVSIGAPIALGLLSVSFSFFATDALAFSAIGVAWLVKGEVILRDNW